MTKADGAVQLEFVLEESPWIRTRDGDHNVRIIFDRHYSRRKYRDGQQQSRLFVGPGEKMVLRTANCDAIFIWRKCKFPFGDQYGINCAVFRNEGTSRSSDLIRAAMDHAWRKWPGARLFTYVDSREVRSKNPGFCFKMAGWKPCGVTKVHRLHILEATP